MSQDTHPVPQEEQEPESHGSGSGHDDGKQPPKKSWKSVCDRMRVPDIWRGDAPEGYDA